MQENLLNKFVLKLSSGEFGFILNQMGPVLLYGIKDPYQGLLVEQIEESQREALRSLADRDLIRILSEDEIAIDEVLAGMITACTEPDHSLMLEYNRPDGTENQSWVHFKDTWIVELKEVDEENVHLTAFQDRQALTEYISPAFELDALAIGTGDRFSLPESSLMEARQANHEGNPKKGDGILRENIRNEVQAQRLAGALIDPVSSSAAVVILANQQENDMQHTRGLAWLGGKEDTWIMAPCDSQGESIIEFIPVGPDEIYHRLMQLLP